METLESLYQTAKRCADVATRRCLGFTADAVALERKVDKTWVTEADQAIEEELRALILSAHPGHGILGEEQGGVLDTDADAITWVLDPIDGTFSFVHGIPFYSSLIAVLKGGVPVVGFACLPGLGIQLSAQRGAGAWVNGERYTRPALVGAPQIEIVATADPYRFRMEGKEATLLRLYGEPFRARTYPDALGYHLLLKGAVRAFVDPKVEVWDVAPFHVILPEAGFRIQTWGRQDKLQRGTSVAYPVDAAGKAIHCEDVLAALDPD